MVKSFCYLPVLSVFIVNISVHFPNSPQDVFFLNIDWIYYAVQLSDFFSGSFLSVQLGMSVVQFPQN